MDKAWSITETCRFKILESSRRESDMEIDQKTNTDVGGVEGSAEPQPEIGASK